jgi:hypothetical protein
MLFSICVLTLNDTELFCYELNACAITQVLCFGLINILFFNFKVYVAYYGAKLGNK